MVRRATRSPPRPAGPRSGAEGRPWHARATGAAATRRVPRRQSRPRSGPARRRAALARWATDGDVGLREDRLVGHRELRGPVGVIAGAQREVRAARAGRYGPARAAAQRFDEPGGRWLTWWVFHSELTPSGGALLPCPPHVHVTRWSLCLYSSMTCLKGSSTTLVEEGRWLVMRPPGGTHRDRAGQRPLGARDHGVSVDCSPIRRNRPQVGPGAQGALPGAISV